MDDLPVIDVGPLVRAAHRDHRDPDVQGVARALDGACRDTGFFLVTGHGIDPTLLARLDAAARRFFARPPAEKAAIAMAHGGRAWRGWFPEGGELTSGRPDHKEGLYFGRELGPDDPRVRAGLPLHGPNQFPAEPAELRPAVLAWMEAVEALGHALAAGIALALGLDAEWFDRSLTAEPTVLFRIFRYPPRPAGEDAWGVAEHTDYGLLTILAHDGTPGLEVRGRDGWLEVPAVPDAFVVNLGDMLDRMTGGRYRSTPHRVRHQPSGPGPTRDRLSFPFFFDPGWDAEIEAVPFGDEPPPDDADTRWDATSVHGWTGTYGDFLTAKVAKVFPGLGDEVL
ncbi:isopenicillin N synthase family oxygenase [Aquihabitans sp. G128]|uniref:isopenicillin N synthase family dioxygenase n=1 Tax=Aquihabitans sp. G128 TaxID=2849779 RepID=UPI001C242C0E|nr:2-oxoglutarate and iron-dependent oxygenase domain-containing protein [Aquihabitans sp. G128]QXC63324.1 isopenicillin N synthase family oxygenase [Aquihabitans sp. G128]